MKLPQFKDWPNACRLKGPLCLKCRAAGERHADWREAQTGMREFACPHDPTVKQSLTVDKDSLTTEPNGLTEAQANLLLAGMTGIPYAATLHIRPRAATTPENAASLLKAMATRERVDDATKAARYAACAACDYLGKDAKGEWCGAPSGCGCNVKPLTMMGLVMAGTSMLSYSEKDGALCKHPHRKAGKGWPA